MKHILPITLLAVAFALPASAETISENEREIQQGRSAIQKDNADIQRYQGDVEQHRAIKADAKARGAYGTQAKESVAIGGKKTVIGAKKVEKNVDQRMLNEDLEDRQAYNRSTGRVESRYGDKDYRYGSASPSAGSNMSYQDQVAARNQMRESANRNGVLYLDPDHPAFRPSPYPASSKEAPTAKL